MKPIYIPQLLLVPERTQTVCFESFLDGLETLMPVQAHMSVRHGTTFLEVKGKAQTIVTLTCDRCLQQYNHRLSVDTQEIIWLEECLDSDDDGASEHDISSDDLVESLPPQGYFEPGTWIYEQVCLELPQRQICDPNCQGLIVGDQEARTQTTDTMDHRWSVLAALKQQLTGDEPQCN